MHHLLEHINQDIKRRYKSKDEDSTVNKTEYQSKIIPTGGPDKQPKHQVTTISSIKKSGTVIDSEVRPTGVQLKRKAKLPTVIGLTTKHAVGCNTLML